MRIYRKHGSAIPSIALERWKTFGGGDLPVTGIKDLAISGHTTGHTAYEVHSGDQTLLIWGDLVHVMAVQMGRPEVSIEFDTDQKQAVAAHCSNASPEAKPWRMACICPFPASAGYARIATAAMPGCPLSMPPAP